MNGAELKALRTAIGLKQTEMAREMGLAVRLYQDLEADEQRIRQRHVNSAERVSMRFAVSRRNPMLALPSIRQEALELVDMIRGLSPVSTADRSGDGFRVIELELGAYGEMISRKIIGESFRTRIEAGAEAKRAAERYRVHGHNEEQGYWWGRDPASKVYRFIVEAD